jgi:hypothetical protein
MSKTYCTTVKIEAVIGYSNFLGHGARRRSESLVMLIDINVKNIKFVSL